MDMMMHRNEIIIGCKEFLIKTPTYITKQTILKIIV